MALQLHTSPKTNPIRAPALYIYIYIYLYQYTLMQSHEQYKNLAAKTLTRLITQEEVTEIRLIPKLQKQIQSETIKLQVCTSCRRNRTRLEFYLVYALRLTARRTTFTEHHICITMMISKQETRPQAVM